MRLARFQYAPRDSFTEFSEWRLKAQLDTAERGDALLVIYGADPDLLKDQDKDLVSLSMRSDQTHMLPVSRLISNDATNWCILGHPIPAWAARVFPDDTPERRLERLWDAVFRVCRLDQADPVAAWRAHVDELAARSEYLTSRRYKALHYKAPGTDLMVGLPATHIWRSGRSTTPSGITFTANMPTEEAWSAPHRADVEGVVSSTKPLSYAGTLIENIRLKFEKGRAVEATASSGEAVLRKLIETDDGSSRLGEVALVPNSSIVSKAGVLFYDTLFDENASCHFALGRAYRNCVEGGQTMSDEEFAAAGGNMSIAHVDFMVGSDKLDIDGITRDGKKEPVLRAGEWAFPARV
jgi:aminopeptidase